MPDGAELEYREATDLVRSLTDVRFKLLAFVPTIAGAAVALLGRHSRPAELLAVGALGFVATLGVIVYELHNTELYEYALARAEALEQQLGIGLLGGRPRHAHDRPLALVYAVAMGAWSYLVGWGALAAAGAGHAQQVGGGIGAASAMLVGLAMLRAHEEPAGAGSSALTSSGS